VLGDPRREQRGDEHQYTERDDRSDQHRTVRFPGRAGGKPCDARCLPDNPARVWPRNRPRPAGGELIGASATSSHGSSPRRHSRPTQACLLFSHSRENRSGAPSARDGHLQPRQGQP
jgi:hypothetical protein